MSILRKSDSGTPRPVNFSGLALNLAAVVGTVCLLVTAATLIFGLKPLVFVSGSMGPAIPTGSLGFAVPTPVQELDPGDVVSVVSADNVRITHRIVENSPSGLVLKGDANPVADLQPYAVTSADKLIVSVPVIGYVVSWFGQPWMYFLAGLLCAYVLWYAFLKRPTSDGSEGPSTDVASKNHTTRSRPRRKSKVLFNTVHRTFGKCLVPLVLTVTMVIVLVSPPLVEDTHAAFTGTAVATAKPTAGLANPPQNVTCVQGSGGTTTDNRQTIVLNWAQPTTNGQSPSKYVLTAQITHNYGTPVVGAAVKSIDIPANSTTTSLDIKNSGGLIGGLLGLLGDLLSSYDYKISVKLVAEYASGWSSTAVEFNEVNASNVILIGPKLLSCLDH